MKNFKVRKLVSFIAAASAFILLLCVSCSCTVDTSASSTGSVSDVNKTQVVANNLQSNQPTPTDISYSLERYNLIRRAYWVNGMREKAVSLACEVEKPMGYVILFVGSTVVAQFTVDGKVSSLNSYLTPDSEYYEYSGTSESYHSFKNEWLADVDGSYGENDSGIFFFTVDGKYIEWTGTYLYTDIPVTIENPVVQYEVSE